VAEFTSIQGALQANSWGANQPYFGKRGEYLEYSPQELKIRILRSFPVKVGRSGRKKEPEMGFFSLVFQTLIFPVYPTKINEEGDPLTPPSL